MDFCLDGVRQISTLTTEYMEHETGKTLIGFSDTLSIGNKEREVFNTRHETYYGSDNPWLKEFYENITYILPSIGVFEWQSNEYGFYDGKLYSKFFKFLEEYLGGRLKRDVKVTIANSYCVPDSVSLSDNSLLVVIKTESPEYDIVDDFSVIRDEHTITLYVFSTNPDDYEYRMICYEHEAISIAYDINEVVQRFKRLLLMD